MAIDASLRIKNLSIALEALSRFPGTGELSFAIETSLQEEIRKFRKEQQEEAQWPHQSARPATPPLRDPYQDDKDEIPF